MAATTTKTKDARSGKGGGGKGAAAARAKDEERAAKQKAKEKEAARKAKEKEAARKAKDKEREAKRKEKEREARRKEKEREARAKEKQRSEREKEKQREQKAKERRDKEKAARAKEKEREQKAKDKQREARRKEKEREARFADKHPARHRAHADGSAPADTDTADTDTADTDTADTAPAGTAPDDTAPDDNAPDDNAPDDTDGPPAAADVQVGQQEVQPAEDVAVPERGETTDVAEHPGLAPLPELDVPDNDTAVHPKGYLAAALGKEDAVTRSTQRATVAASYTTRDHDLIRAWAQTRGGRPADVVGTGNGGAGVLRIEFPDGPGDDSRLEDVDWGPFFRTFDESDVDFLYQERVRTGDVSRFHKIVRADA